MKFFTAGKRGQDVKVSLLNERDPIDSPGLCFARPPSLSLRDKEDSGMIRPFHPLSGAAEERVDRPPIGGPVGVSKLRKRPALQERDPIDSPGLCCARPPSLSLRDKEGRKMLFFHPLSGPAEERVDRPPIGGLVGVSKLRRIFLICILILLVMGFTAFSQPQQIKHDMQVDGMKRSFLTYIPAITDNKQKMPLVISLHGGLASPKGQFHLADFRPLADKDKFIVVCPASKHIFHDGRDNKGIDDVKFIDQIITYIIDTYHADPARVYVTGISNGGFMTSRVACELSDRIAAIAVVAGTLDEGEGYAPVKPMPVIYMHGTKDPVFSDKGGKIFGRMVYSQKQVLKVWADLDKCNPEPVITTMPDTANDGTSIIKEEYTNPHTGFKVIGYSIVNGGHTWPGGWQYMPRFIVGKTTKNLNACNVIWDFFKQYKL